MISQLKVFIENEKTRITNDIMSEYSNYKYEGLDDSEIEKLKSDDKVRLELIGKIEKICKARGRF